MNSPTFRSGRFLPFMVPGRVLALVLATGTCLGAAAQDSPGKKEGRPAGSNTKQAQPDSKGGARSAPGGQESGINAKPVHAGASKLVDEPIRIDSVGLSFFPLEGVQGETTSIGGQSSVALKPADGSWVVNVLTPRTSNADTTIEDVCNEAIKQIASGAGAVYQDGKLLGWKGRIIAQEYKLAINGSPAARFYLEVPQGEKDPSLVRGYTVFKVGNDRFTIFDLTTTGKEFEKVRGQYETLVGTAKFMDAGELAASRGAAVAAGLKLMQGIDDQGLRDIVSSSPERWERLYKPGTTGAASDDTEIAYRRIRSWLGKRGELNTARKNDQYRGIDAQEGILVRIDARQIVDGRVFDSQGMYFVSMDREEEAWTLSNNVREGTSRSVATETGARAGKSMTVSTVVTGDPGQTIKPMIQGDGYISRVESFLLPRILIRGGVPADYGFYVYQSDTANIRLRRDELSQPSDAPNVWKISTKLKEDAKAMVSIYNSKGEFIRTEMPDGSRWEPTTLDKLVKLWREKNLPLD